MSALADAAVNLANTVNGLTDALNTRDAALVETINGCITTLTNLVSDIQPPVGDSTEQSQQSVDSSTSLTAVPSS